MKNARTLAFLGALACSALLVGCATDEAATCSEGACADKAATCETSCADKAASCSEAKTCCPETKAATQN